MRQTEQYKLKHLTGQHVPREIKQQGKRQSPGHLTRATYSTHSVLATSAHRTVRLRPLLTPHSL